MNPYCHRGYYRGWYWADNKLYCVFDDGQRLILTNSVGNVMFNGTYWLANQCLKRGWFV